MLNAENLSQDVYYHGVKLVFDRPTFELTNSEYRETCLMIAKEIRKLEHSRVKS